MRTLDYNKRTFYYCLYNAKAKRYDADGNFTGEHNAGYEEAVEAKGNISAASGSAEIEQFGTGIEYDKVIILQGTDWNIDEHTVLFIDTQPTYNDDQHTDPKYNYIVTRVAKSLNHTSIAIKRVNHGDKRV